MLHKTLALTSILLGACVVGEDSAPSTPAGPGVESLARTSCPANTPAALAPAANQTLAFSLSAKGVQEYTCEASGTSFAWTFIAPDAQLFHDQEIVGHHFAGPTWQYEDGSEVVGSKVAAVTVDPKSIPWLLLTAASHAGEGQMTEVTSIQRLTTVGGLAPATGCDAKHVGASANIKYTAVYYFYRLAEPGERTVRCGA